MDTDGLVDYTQDGRVATITMDDGRANALSPAMQHAIHAALDRAEAEEAAVVLAGRPGRFCAGFDLQIMSQGAEATADALTRIGRSLLTSTTDLPSACRLRATARIRVSLSPS